MGAGFFLLALAFLLWLHFGLWVGRGLGFGFGLALADGGRGGGHCGLRHSSGTAVGQEALFSLPGSRSESTMMKLKREPFSSDTRASRMGGWSNHRHDLFLGCAGGIGMSVPVWR